MPMRGVMASEGHPSPKRTPRPPLLRLACHPPARPFLCCLPNTQPHLDGRCVHSLGHNVPRIVQAVLGGGIKLLRLQHLRGSSVIRHNLHRKKQPAKAHVPDARETPGQGQQGRRRVRRRAGGRGSRGADLQRARGEPGRAGNGLARALQRGAERGLPLVQRQRRRGVFLARAHLQTGGQRRRRRGGGRW